MIMDGFYVYEHWRTDTGACFYVGKGQRRRAYNMSSRSRPHKWLQSQVASNGGAIEVVLLAHGLTEEEAFSLERDRIRFWRDAGQELVNFTDGGEGASGARRSQETKEKLAASRRGKKREPFNAEWRENLGRATRGKRRSPEAVAKTAAAHRGSKRSAETCAKISAALTGRKLSDQARRAISEGKKGRPHPYVRTRKMGDAEKAKLKARMAGNTYGAKNAGRPKSPEHVAKMAAKAREWWRLKKTGQLA